MRENESWSVSRKLILGILLFAVIGLTVAFVFVVTLVHSIVHENVLESTRRDRTIQAGQVDAWFMEANRIVYNLSETMPLVSRTYYEDIVAHILYRYAFAESVWVALYDGGFYDSARWVPPDDFVFTDRPWWEASAPRSGEVVITLPYLSQEIDDLALAFARHLSDWRGQEGVIAMNIEMAQLNEIMNEFILYAEGYLILTAPGGEIIFHPGREYMPTRYGFHTLADFEAYAEVYAAFAEGDPNPRRESHDGVMSYFMQMPLPSTGWTFIAVVPTTVVTTPVLQIQLSVLITIIVVLVVISSLSYIFISRSVTRAREISELTQVFMESSPLCIELREADSGLVYCNRQVLDLLGVSSKEEYSARFAEFSPKYQPCGTLSDDKFVLQVEEVLATGRVNFEWLHLNAQGEPVPMDVTVVCIMRGGKKMLVSYSHDLRPAKAVMDKQRELENALHEQRMNDNTRTMELTQQLLDNSPVFVELWDADGNMVYCNGKMTELLGTSNRDEFTERFFKCSAPTQANGIPTGKYNAQMLDYALEHGTARCEWLFVLPTGEEMPTESTWVHFMHQGKPLIVAYSVDLRPIRSAMEALESNEAKSRFLARMSHELRTPISAVLSISEVQLRNQAMPPGQEEVFERIYDSAKMLLNIVNDILDLSKIESGMMTIVNEEYDVASLVGDVAQLHTLYSERGGVGFKVAVDENLPAKLVGDPLRIRQIISNLLTNAFKYTEAGMVSLSLRREQLSEGRIYLLICIQDTGMGMTKEQITGLNVEYTRFHEREKPNIGGTGLGIPIIYSLAKMMDAKFDLTSEAGKGTLAIIAIPQEVAGAELLGSELATSLQNLEIRSWSAARELQFVPTQLPHGRVLVVDDVNTNLYVMEAMLDAFGIQGHLCERAGEAIEQIKAGAVYDVIFMDHMMPEMDGVEATQALRAMGYDAPIVALTADAISGQAEMFMANGFTGFMTKPVDIELLDSYLVRFIPPTE
jgi:signal transduction histidine kinase/PAS domain-containing protein